MYARLIKNHVLANLTFVLVLLVGFISYQQLPRQQDPTINFNWLTIITTYPGASAADVEKSVTDVLESAIKGSPDMRFVSSNSRENVSSILVRFEDLDVRTYDKRLSDLRSDLQSVQGALPDAASDPTLVEITSGNAFPAALIAVTSLADDEHLRQAARLAEEKIEQMSGVDRVDTIALDKPELILRFNPVALEEMKITPGQLSDSLKLWFQDVSAGTMDVGNQSWLVRLVGKNSDPFIISQLPIPGLQGEVPLSRVATVERSHKKSTQDARIDGKPAILLSVLKQDNTNVIRLVEDLRAWLKEQNEISSDTGIQFKLIDDQTLPTLKAIKIMQSNAVIGLLLVLFVVWLFLGSRIALLTTIGIPFILAATFWILSATGETLNVTVLLGVVIVLGMLVDDTVVVVEAIYYRIQRGEAALIASVNAMKEISMPVTTAVLTTIAAFLPLMLLPGILGKFMKVIPMVVSLALLISLIEAFWMLPSHVSATNMTMQSPSWLQRRRIATIHWIQLKYSRLLIKALRWPKLTLLTIIIAFISAAGIMGAGLIKVDFFATDGLRLFYVNIEMPATTPLEKTMKTTLLVEQQIKKHLTSQDVRSVASYSGMMFTETEPLYGQQYGQIIVSLLPKEAHSRDVLSLIEDMREDVIKVKGANNISFLPLVSGPPSSKAISVKVRGDDYAKIKAATDSLSTILKGIKGIKDISTDASLGRMELTLRMDHDAIRRAGINPVDITRTIRLLVDGEIVASMQDNGEKLIVRVKAQKSKAQNLSSLLEFRLPSRNGNSIALSELVTQERNVALGNIRHYNFRRAITLEANFTKLTKPEDFWKCRGEPFINQLKRRWQGLAPLGDQRDYSQCQLDTVTANKMLLEGWNKIKKEHSSIDLDFSGQLDDIEESIDAMGKLFLIGIGLMYLILGTQFRSYFQPFIVLATIPLAFTGVVFGLLVTSNPLSLYTLYGIVALAGIAVNAAIVLISAANDRLNAGMSVIHSTVYAARRRVIPILITTLTTIAGLFSLAIGLGGDSLLWGPVATAIVWGVGFSSILTLFAIPTLYRAGMARKKRK